MKSEESTSTCMVSPTKMAQIGEDVGVYKATKKQIYSFLSAIPAGAFIALHSFSTQPQTGNGDAPWGLQN